MQKLSKKVKPVYSVKFRLKQTKGLIKLSLFSTRSEHWIWFMSGSPGPDWCGPVNTLDFLTWFWFDLSFLWWKTNRTIIKTKKWTNSTRKYGCENALRGKHVRLKWNAGIQMTQRLNNNTLEKWVTDYSINKDTFLSPLNCSVSSACCVNHAS